MSQYEDSYKNLIWDVLESGIETTDRTGTGTTEVLGLSFRVPADSGFPILTGRQIYYKGVLGELAALLRGATSVATFKQLGCNYWDSWGKAGGYLGPIYNHFWVHIANSQLLGAIQKIKTDPDTRQALVSGWDPLTLPDMALPPCHFAFQLFNRDNKLALVVYQRSLDIMIGLPSDVVLYGVLQRLIAKELKLGVGDLLFNVGSGHIYKNHLDAASEYLERATSPLPGWTLTDTTTLPMFTPVDFSLQNYEHAGPLKNKLPLAV